MTVAFKSEEGKKEVLKYYDILLTKGSLPKSPNRPNATY